MALKKGTKTLLRVSQAKRRKIIATKTGGPRVSKEIASSRKTEAGKLKLLQRKEVLGKKGTRDLIKKGGVRGVKQRFFGSIN